MRLRFDVRGGGPETREVDALWLDHRGLLREWCGDGWYHLATLVADSHWRGPAGIKIERMELTALDDLAVCRCQPSPEELLPADGLVAEGLDSVQMFFESGWARLHNGRDYLAALIDDGEETAWILPGGDRQGDLLLARPDFFVHPLLAPLSRAPRGRVSPLAERSQQLTSSR